MFQDAALQLKHPQITQTSKHAGVSRAPAFNYHHETKGEESMTI